MKHRTTEDIMKNHEKIVTNQFIHGCQRELYKLDIQNQTDLGSIVTDDTHYLNQLYSKFPESYIIMGGSMPTIVVKSN